MKTSINFKAVKSDSEVHNYRKKSFDYIRKDLTQKNEYWKQESIKDRLEKIENYCKEKSGRKLQKNAMPIREAVVVIKENTTMHELNLLAKKLEDELRIKIFQIVIHKDEGHYDKDTKDWKPNLHAHLVADWQDPETGKTLKHQGFHYSKMQDITAECLGMERGVSGGKKRLEALEFKIEQKEVELSKIEHKINSILKEFSLSNSKDLIVTKSDFWGVKKIESDKTIENFKSALKHQNIENLKTKSENERKENQLQVLINENKHLKNVIVNLKKSNSVILLNPNVLDAERKKYLNEVKFTLERKIQDARLTTYYSRNTDPEKLNAHMVKLCEQISKENSIPFKVFQEIFENEVANKQLFSLLQFGNSQSNDEDLDPSKKRKFKR